MQRTKWITFILAASLLASSCSHLTTTSDNSKSGLTGSKAAVAESDRIVDPELDAIPVDMHPLVDKWVDYFTGRGRPHMEVYLSRSTRYGRLMKQIIRDNGLPEDLFYIALIESGFSSKATSRAAAVGYWQFIRGTGKAYNLEINALIDERRDPILSTQAAAEYFKGLYSIFGSWYLSMASYNAGENRIKRVVMNNMTRDFWVLAEKKKLPRETINYVPKYIAAKLIAKNPEKYGFVNIDYLPEIEFEHFKFDRPVNLKAMAEKMNVDYEEFKALNPKFKGEIAPLSDNKLELKIPVGSQKAALIAANASVVDRVVYVADAGETQIYRVRKGDTLSTIARKYRTTLSWLRDTNDLKSGRKLRIGQRLQVPERDGGPMATVIAAKAKPAPVNPVIADNGTDEEAKDRAEVVTKKGVFYIVQPGDNLTRIAEDYGSSIEELRRLNKLKRGSHIKIGMRLRVPKDEPIPKDLAQEKDGARPERLSLQRTPSQTKAKKSLKVAKSKTPLKTKSTERVHTVRRGENLTHIADKYNISLNKIREANQISNGSKLFVGAKLVISSVYVER